jgi:hypothetical protein
MREQVHYLFSTGCWRPDSKNHEGSTEKGKNLMRKMKVLAAVLSAFAAAIVLTTAAPAQAQGPRYLVALSDLRTARDYIQSDHRHEFGSERHHAVDEINKAIDEIKHAAWDDGKQTKYAPPAHPDSDPWHPMRESMRWLDEARGHVMEGPDRPENAGLRDRAVIHIDEARHSIDEVIRLQAH